MTHVPSDVSSEEFDGGPIAARIYRRGSDEVSPPVVLHLRANAFGASAASLPVEDDVALILAETGAVVVVPEHSDMSTGPFHEVLNSAFGMLTYLHRQRAQFGGRESLLLVAGAESGGTIAAGLALKARDHTPGSLDGQVLISPMLDPSMGGRSFQQASAKMRERWAEGWNRYLGFSGGVCHPYAAPRYCSRLLGLAPALMLTAADDPLRDEGVAFAQALTNAGVFVDKHEMPTGLGWTSLSGDKPEHGPAWQLEVGKCFERFLSRITGRAAG